MDKNKIISFFLKHILEIVFFSANFFSFAIAGKKSRNLKLRTGTALIAVITLLSACKNSTTQERKANPKIGEKLQKITNGISSTVYSNASRIIYLHLVSCFNNKIDQPTKMDVGEIQISTTSNNNNHDARCYMPPPPDDSVFYKLDN